MNANAATTSHDVKQEETNDDKEMTDLLPISEITTNKGKYDDNWKHVEIGRKKAKRGKIKIDMSIRQHQMGEPTHTPTTKEKIKARGEKR
eukprot:12795437-Ditylum_brightwellii.AAC.1